MILIYLLIMNLFVRGRWFDADGASAKNGIATSVFVDANIRQNRDYFQCVLRRSEKNTIFAD